MQTNNNINEYQPQRLAVDYNIQRIKDRYYQWLCDIVNTNQTNRSYFLLIKTLHQKMFYWTVPNDDNRALDGKTLRDGFILDHPFDNNLRGHHASDIFGGPCTMLEMLIGLANRMDGMTKETDEEGKMSVWFWEILRNCGLEKFTDEVFVELGGTIEIHIILNKVLERTFKRNGQRGLFPLKFAKKDQRKVEIWYQMCQYILENCYLEDVNV